MTSIIPTPQVSLINGRPSVSSLKVAEHFGKRHDNVIRDIKKIMSNCPKEFNALNFEEVKYTDGKGEEREAYDLYRDGFILVVMSYTGAKAMQIKIAYIARFNEMEQALQSAQAELESTTITPAQQRELHNILDAKLSTIPKGERAKAYSQAWARFNRHFKIAGYAQLPTTLMSEGITYLIDMVIKGGQVEQQQPPALLPARSDYEVIVKSILIEVQQKRAAYAKALDDLLFAVNQPFGAWAGSQRRNQDAFDAAVHKSINNAVYVLNLNADLTEGLCRVALEGAKLPRLEVRA